MSPAGYFEGLIPFRPGAYFFVPSAVCMYDWKLETNYDSSHDVCLHGDPPVLGLDARICSMGIHGNDRVLKKTGAADSQVHPIGK